MKELTFYRSSAQGYVLIVVDSHLLMAFYMSSKVEIRPEGTD